jgi:vesicle coat complex subunit
MKTRKKLVLVLLAFLIVGLAASCNSTGQYVALTNEETVIGTVQSTFVVHSSLFFMKSAKDAVNMESYIHLMEVANQKYSGNFDIRDIVWVTGRSVDNQNTEISATGKVVRAE